MTKHSLGIGQFVKLIMAIAIVVPAYAATKRAPVKAQISAKTKAPAKKHVPVKKQAPVKMQASVETSAAFKTSILKLHNEERVRLGSQPLEWDEVLAKDAKNWASSLSSKGEFEHAFSELAQKKQGENLALGRTGFFTTEQLVTLWLDERSMTKTGIFPDVTTSESWSDVGHYTQMMWPSTTKVGCAVKRGKSDDYLVCRYWPAGNRIGEKLHVGERD